MYVFPGKALNVNVEFLLGEDPASPSVAAFVVKDQTGEIVPSTSISLNPGDTDAWITVPPAVHVLPSTERFRQHRIDVTYDVNNLVFDMSRSYFIVPDLFLSFTSDDLRGVLGVGASELQASQIDFYRSYIDLAAGKYGDDFFNALTGNDLNLKFAAQQLIYWHTAHLMLPTVRMQAIKTVESETSKLTKLATSTNLNALEEMIDDKYAYYLSLIQTSSSALPPTIFMVDNPTDPITG